MQPQFTLSISGTQSEIQALLTKVGGVATAAPAATTKTAKTGKGKTAAPAEEFELDASDDTETTEDLDLDNESAGDDEPEVTLKEIQTAAQKLATKKGGKEKLSKIFKKLGIKALKELDSDDYAQAHELITA